ncbi:ABC transporter permease [Haloarchaeobius sp. HME9146]|uniref:ABC transporter permease n=1 Tax=Haloarchaeobius sp. HME9146 TaxID=2978732 RepID=UPI0021BF1ED8|nr:ABC transporter permease [Haloarchaeobius sp. HME9146]
MKLTETPTDAEDDRPNVEALVGGIEAKGAGNSVSVYQQKVEANLVAPLRIAWYDWRAKLGLSIVAFFVFMATIWEPMYDEAYLNYAPSFIKPFDSEYRHYIFGIEQFTIPVIGWTYTGIWQYPLGTNEVGQPILMRIVNAAPAMAELVLAGGVVSIGVAVIVGTTAGYKGGRIDDVLMGATDVMMTIPGLPLVLLLAAVFQPSDPFVLGMILAIDNWPGLARSLRSQVLTIRNESYVESSRTMGVSTGGILFKDVIPQLMPYILISAAAAGKRVITEAVGLYFLGFLPQGAPNWGKMMNDAYEMGAITSFDTFYIILWPMLVLAMLSFGLVMLAQGLDKIFNPRLRARHSRSVGGDGEAD